MDRFTELEAQAKAEKEKKELDYIRIKSDWSELFFGSERGMRVFADFLEVSDFFGTNFTGNSKQYFLEGMRFFVSHIIRSAGLDTPEGLHKLAQIRAAAEQRSTK